MAKYSLNITTHTLTEVARQALDSGILSNATTLRHVALNPHNSAGKDMWGYLQQSADLEMISGSDFIEKIEESYRDIGAEQTIILTRTNKRTNIYNQGIRARILWREEEIENGDRLMVSKNNYFWTEKYENLPFLANGDMLEISRLRNIREMYGFHFADANCARWITIGR